MKFCTEGAMRRTTPPKNWIIRIMWGAMWRQKSRAIVCPSEPRLDGKLALVTGGNGGIGYQTCRGLLKRGAEVIMASRNATRAGRACQRLREELGEESPISFVKMDLGDLDSVAAGAKALDSMLAGRAIDVLVANAGMAPTSYETSPQGHELTFATNVLGHHLLIRLSQPHLAEGTRVIILTGDIYCRSHACTPDHFYEGKKGCMLAYCRSKLGNLWQAQQLQERHPELIVVAVHPGVIDSNLGGGTKDEPDKQKQAAGRSRFDLRIDCELGAQTTLWCSTAADLVAGDYYHNTYGLMDLRPTDPAHNKRAARELWETCEQLCDKWLPSSSNR